MHACRRDMQADGQASEHAIMRETHTHETGQADGWRASVQAGNCTGPRGGAPMHPSASEFWTRQINTSSYWRIQHSLPDSLLRRRIADRAVARRVARRPPQAWIRSERIPIRRLGLRVPKAPSRRCGPWVASKVNAYACVYIYIYIYMYICNTNATPNT